MVRIGLFILLGGSGGLNIWNWELEDERSVTSLSIGEDKHNAHIRGTMMEEFRERYVKDIFFVSLPLWMFNSVLDQHAESLKDELDT